HQDQEVGSDPRRQAGRLSGDPRSGPYRGQGGIGRLRLCRQLVQRSVPAHGQCVAGAGQGQEERRGHDRRCRGRHLH
ncbi:hypothetical protein LTR94_038177, partial [Friedmanniomyces endolithicus]